MSRYGKSCIQSLAILGFLMWSAVTAAQIEEGAGLLQFSDETQNCVECHRKLNPGLYQQWGDSAHFRAGVGCFECHQAEDDDPDVMEDHNGHTISVIVSPKDCARCHAEEVKQFSSSHHAKAGRILGSLDNVLAEVVEGNRGLKTSAFPHGTSAVAVNGCWQCHGTEVKVLEGGKLDPATFPNSGIGRLNPDGSEGSCAACHARHSFSVAEARHPDSCGKCHLGPDHPQKEIYAESKHGIAFAANIKRMNLHSSKWIVGEDYWAAPTCATCHMSATKNQSVTHDVGMRISWNNRPIVSVRPEQADKKLGLPGADVPWQIRRKNMKDVCSNCHNKNWVDAFYIQYDGLVELYNDKFAKVGKELMAAAKPLRHREAPFANKVDWVWFELWHHEGRRARHGASMMAPDYTHWHGMYDVAKSFYTEVVPELLEMAEKGQVSTDPAKKAAAAKLMETIRKVFDDSNHRWAVDKMDPSERAMREKARREFLERYKRN